MSDFIYKICNADCSYDELYDFCERKGNIDVKCANSFQFYYDLSYILNVFNKFNSKKINARFIAYWSNAYRKILLSRYPVKVHKEGKISLKYYIQSQIIELLDNLSYFDLGKHNKEDELYDYENDFTFYDTLLNWLNEANIYYYIADESSHKVNSLFLFINNNEKKFARLVWRDYAYKSSAQNEKEINKQEYTEMIEELNKTKFFELD